MKKNKRQQAVTINALWLPSALCLLSSILSSFRLHPCLSDSFSVNASQCSQQRAAFGLRGADAGEALAVRCS